MNRVFVSYNNIVSSLGFDSDTVALNVKNELSGLSLIDDKRISSEPFYSSMVPMQKLEQSFKEIDKGENYTKLEKMMLVSLSKVIKEASIELTDRVGLIVSTTKGNIEVLQPNSIYEKERAYLGSLGKVIKDFFGFVSEAIVVSNACVSGILAVSIAKRYIDQGVYDHVFVVSGDVVSEFILSGFNSFQALSPEPCKPYCKDRAGINIGEVAASILVTNNQKNLSNTAMAVLGAGSCNDANHISGPSRTGEGLYKSISSALQEAQISVNTIDYISAHGTATVYNDEMEAIAFNRAGLAQVPVNSFKGYFGHTLGASGLLETILGMHSVHQNWLYKSLGYDEIGVSQSINVIQQSKHHKMNRFLKTASGFGGCNTAVIFEKIANG